MMTNGRTAFLPVGQRLSNYPPLAGDHAFDAIVVGGGITGLSTALLLGHAGLHVAVVEARRIGGGATGFSTGQLTSFIDDGYVALEKDFGEEGARGIARLTTEAIAMVEDTARALAIDCRCRRVPTVLYAESEDKHDELVEEHAAAVRAGLPARLERRGALPFATKGQLVLDDQLDLDPSAYVQGLSLALPSNVAIFEGTRVLSIGGGDPFEVETPNGVLRAPFVIEATHVPGGRNSFHAKTAAYRSYVVTARTEGGLPPGIYADLLEPYHYLREHEGLVMLGGEDHKTGQRPDGAAPYEALERYLRERFPVREIVDRWTTELYAPVDGLPYIGPMGLAGAETNHLIATGFDGDGLLFGSLAAKILSGIVLARTEPAWDLLKPQRATILASAKNFVKEQANVAFHLVGDRLAPAPKDPDALAPGEGDVLDIDGKRCAAYRDERGVLHVRSATCPHAGCVVQWNADASTFDCPCHGGCFSPRGEVLGGPPNAALAEVDRQG